jgi:hypothetical protein
VLVIMMMLLMAATGSALVLITTTETRIAAAYRSGTALLDAAEGVMASAISDLAGIADWDAALTGVATARLTDGMPGIRAIAGTAVDALAITNDLRCGRVARCADADMDAMTADRPWGRNNPRWQLFAWGRLRTLVPALPERNDAYLLVWIGDDGAEEDGDPLHDASGEADPGRGTVVLVAHAYGAGGMRRAIQATIARAPEAGPAGGPVRVISWREVR